MALAQAGHHERDEHPDEGSIRPHDQRTPPSSSIAVVMQTNARVDSRQSLAAATGNPLAPEPKPCH